VIRGVSRVHGVTAVEDHLIAHRVPGTVPALQGGGPGPRLGWLARRWAPAPRLLTGAAGLALAGYGLSRRGRLRAVLGGAGLALLGRSITNGALRRGTRAGLDLVQHIQVNVPVTRAFAYWRAWERLPRFLPWIKSVRPLDARRSRWTVETGSGQRVEWGAEVTRIVPNELIAWRGADGGPHRHEGSVHFAPDGDGSTHIEVRLRCRRAFTEVLGPEPRRQLEDDLVRFKDLMESGTTG
jgi:uncharacterized membrane protein